MALPRQLSVDFHNNESIRLSEKRPCLQNAVGLLGAGGMVNIMWTSNNIECCPDEPHSDIFFQERLYLGVYPMVGPPGTPNRHTGLGEVTSW